MPYRVLILCAVAVLVGIGGFLVYSAVAPTPATTRTIPTVPEPQQANWTLSEEEKAYLWDIEHHGNLLVSNGFKPLTEALVQGNRRALERSLAANFTGAEPSQLTSETLRTSVLDVTRGSGGDLLALPLSRADFIQRLMEWRMQFSSAPSAKLALMALSPVTRGKLDGPWQGTGQLRLWGEWERGKPAEVIAYLRYQIRQPTEENLAAGGWLTSCTITQVQLGKAEHFLFKEVAAERGINPRQFHDNWKGEDITSQTGGVYSCDFNRDGYTDLLITDIKGIYLYEGLPGGKFRDVTEQMGLNKESGRTTNLRACFVDLDNDGWEDLILGSQVFRNDQGRRFVRVELGAEVGQHTLFLPPDGSAIVAADYDRDGLVDLYLTRPGPMRAGDWLTGKSGDREGNHLYRNLGNFQFKDVTHEVGVDGDQRSSFTSAWLDADNDGWPDLYVINEFGDAVLYQNLGRSSPDGEVRFRPRHVAKIPCDFGAMGVAVGDIDNDNRIDIYSGNMYSKAGGRVIGNLRPDTYPEEVMARMRTFVTGSQLHHNLGDFRFEQLGKAWQVNDCGWAYGPALVDLDNDGFLDLHATCGFISRSRDEPDG
jgi:hypothetical protein